MRETLIKDCPKFGNWHDPCRAYYVGLNDWWPIRRPEDYATWAESLRKAGPPE